MTAGGSPVADWTETPIDGASVGDVLAGIAARESIPGGGAVAALCAAMAAALVSMVARYTIGNKSYAAVEAEAQAILERSETFRAGAVDLAGADARAYGRVRDALAEKKKELEGWEERLKAANVVATEVPLSTARLSLEVLEDCARLAEIGNRYLLSDVGVAAACARSAVEGAAMNVAANAPSLEDDLRERVNAEIRSATDAARSRSEAILKLLGGGQ